MIYVIGSGPAGVSASMALLEKGLKVTMLDVGQELETDRLKLLQQVQKTHEHKWEDSLLNSLKGNLKVTIKGLPRKLVYGSDFCYRDENNFIPMKTRGSNFLPTLAKGGFSNVWGGSILPYTDSDIDSWPINISDLIQSYKNVLSFMDLTGFKDDLENFFPLYSDTNRPLIPSQQVITLLSHWRKYAHKLKEENLYFGYSRLAVRSYSKKSKSGCVYCGMCLHGCPHELIYNSSFTLSEMQNDSNFTYAKDILVKRVEEKSSTVKIHARNTKNGENISFNASRVYLAAGVISTTKILLESMEAYEKELILKCSQYFLLPLINYKKQKQVHKESLHTLSQIFIEIFDRNISENTIHLQMYTYNDLYQSVFKNILGNFYPIFSKPIESLNNRLLMIQGYLHSDLSQTSSIYLSLEKDKESSCLHLTANENPQTCKAIKSISEKLFSNRKYLNILPISPMLKVGEFGDGYHVGGSFPMKNNPSNFESDSYGRPHGFEKVHIVDASIFTSIPATTITLTCMANAYRIANAYDQT